MGVGLLLIVILVFAGVFVGAQMAGRLRKGPDHPACGKCGYNVTGLESMVCPECGSDLREVGIMTPSQRPRPVDLGPLLPMLVWTLLLTGLAVAISGALTTNAPYLRETRVQRVIFAQLSYLQTTIQVEEVGTVTSWGRRSEGKPTHLRLSTGTNRATQLDVDLRDKSYEYWNKGGQHIQRPSGYGANAIAEWLNDAGFSTTDSRLLSRADDIVMLVDQIQTGPNGFVTLGKGPNEPFGITAHPAFSFTYSTKWAALALLVFWVMIWIVGIVFIVKRSRRTRAAAKLEAMLA
jgi:hypothetical protein